MADPNLIPLTSLPREIAAAYPDAPVQPYRKLYALNLDGRLPGTQCNGRWFVRRADLPAIGEALGLTSAPVKSKARSAQRVPVTVAA